MSAQVSEEAAPPSCLWSTWVALRKTRRESKSHRRWRLQNVYKSDDTRTEKTRIYTFGLLVWKLIGKWLVNDPKLYSGIIWGKYRWWKEYGLRAEWQAQSIQSLAITGPLSVNQGWYLLHQTLLEEPKKLPFLELGFKCSLKAGLWVSCYAAFFLCDPLPLLFSQWDSGVCRGCWGIIIPSGKLSFLSPMCWAGLGLCICPGSRWEPSPQRDLISCLSEQYWWMKCLS